MKSLSLIVVALEDAVVVHKADLAIKITKNNFQT